MTVALATKEGQKMDEYEMKEYHKLLQERIGTLEKECDRLDKELEEVNEELDECELECETERKAKEETAKALLIEQQRNRAMMDKHQSMMDECMKANESAAKADARAASLVTSLEAAEVQVSVEQRARLEAEKRCTEMMDHIKTLLSIQAKPDKEETPKREKSGFKVQVVSRDGNQDLRELRIVEE